MNIVICDDELTEVEKLYKIINKICHDKLYDIDLRGFTDAAEFLSHAKLVHVDIVFLDIRMKKHNGIEIAKLLRTINKTCSIIFVTNSPDYALNAFTVKADHYLLKPITPDKVLEALNRTKLIVPSSTIEVIIDYIPHSIELDEILYIQSSGRQLGFYMKNNAIFKSYTPISKIADALKDKPEFISCHRTIIINANYVESFIDKKITMIDKFTFSVPLRRYSEIKNLYMDYIFNHLRRKIICTHNQESE